MRAKPCFVIPSSLGTVTGSSNSLAANPPSNLSYHRMNGLTWKTSDNTGSYVQCDFGAAQGIDCIALLGTNAGDGTAQMRVRMAASSGGLTSSPSYDSGLVDIWSDDALGVRQNGYHGVVFPTTTQTYRYMRIDISQAGGPSFFEAVHLVVGKVLELAHYEDFELDQAVSDYGTAATNRNGVQSVANGVRRRRAQFQLSWLTETEVVSSMQELSLSVGTTGPVLLALDPGNPGGNQDRLYFGRFSDDTSLTDKRVSMRRYQRRITIESFI